MNPIELFLQPLLSSWPFLAVFLVIFLIIKVLANRDFKGWLGERRVRGTLASLDPLTHQTHHDIYLPKNADGELTQIDHLVVSSAGIFVIETKNYKGWIFGSEKQKYWTQQIYRSKKRFQNPLHQNALHINSLAAYLDLPKSRFHSLVVFVGDSTFKTDLPENVIDRDLLLWIQARSTPRLIPPEVEEVRTKMTELDRTADRKASAKLHRKSLRMRHG